MHVTASYPRILTSPPIFAQVVGVDEMTRHEDASENCSVPVVVVSSETVPFGFAVQVPVTWCDPVTVVRGQLAPNEDGSN